MNRLGRVRHPFFFAFDFDLKSAIVLPLERIEASFLRFDIDGVGNDTAPAQPPQQEIHFARHPMPYEAYRQVFDQVHAEIRHGNSYLLNLTQPTPIGINLSLSEIYTASVARFRCWFDDRFVVFSPERFVRMAGDQIATFPMKGTINATLPNAEEQILANPKERAEHFTIVDLLRNDLSMVASQVQVRRFRYIERIETLRGSLLQVSSEIVGSLPANWHEQVGSLLTTLLPAGSVSGAPKRRTVEIIRQAEGYERGFYSGIFGYFDGQVLDSAVMIRYIERQGKQLIFKSGGGITALSDARSEYQELIDKVYVPIVRIHPGSQR